MADKSMISNTPIEELNDAQINRYSRTILLKEIGTNGMQNILNATVGIIGGGGLGCPAAQILAASGVGHIRIIDGDIVELSNLSRQILHYTSDIGKSKVQSIKEKLNALNPDVSVSIYETYATKANISTFLHGCDYIIEASDRIATKFLVNDACTYFQIPFTIAGVVQYYGQIVSVLPGKSTCYRCIFSSPLPYDPRTSCSGVGVLNTTPALAGILQANEALKSITGLPVSFLNGLFVFDLLLGSFDFIKISRNPTCDVCVHPEIPFYLTVDYEDSLKSCTI